MRYGFARSRKGDVIGVAGVSESKLARHAIEPAVEPMAEDIGDRRTGRRALWQSTFTGCDVIRFPVQFMLLSFGLGAEQS